MTVCFSNILFPVTRGLSGCLTSENDSLAIIRFTSPLKFVPCAHFPESLRKSKLVFSCFTHCV